MRERLPPKDDEPLTDQQRVDAELTRLSAEDRALAEDQGSVCAWDGRRLGLFGPPVKIETDVTDVLFCSPKCANEGGIKIAVEVRRHLKAVAHEQIRHIESALDAYYIHMGHYPSTDQGLEALQELPSGLDDPTRWRGPYLDGEVPLDPWGHHYQYEWVSWDRFRVWSVGKVRAGP